MQGPIALGGVRDAKTVSPHGVYKVDIPLHNGKSTVMRAVCLNQVTSKFPMYPLHGQVQKDIIKNYKLGSYFVQQLILVRMGYQVNPDVHLLSGTQERCSFTKIWRYR